MVRVGWIQGGCLQWRKYAKSRCSNRTW